MVRAAIGRSLRWQAVMFRFAWNLRGPAQGHRRKNILLQPPCPLTSCGYVWSIFRSAANSVRPESREDSVVRESKGAPHKKQRRAHNATRCMPQALAPPQGFDGGSVFHFQGLAFHQTLRLFLAATHKTIDAPAKKRPPGLLRRPESREETPKKASVKLIYSAAQHNSSLNRTNHPASIGSAPASTFSP